MNVKVRHWRHDDGWRYVPEFLRKLDIQSYEFDEEMVGWHCWVYADQDFEDWMRQNMTGLYDCTFRFNSGDPMYTVHIVDEQDATIFRLRWLTCEN